jgi:hypothetical protein
MGKGGTLSLKEGHGKLKIFNCSKFFQAKLEEKAFQLF